MVPGAEEALDPVRDLAAPHILRMSLLNGIQRSRPTPLSPTLLVLVRSRVAEELERAATSRQTGSIFHHLVDTFSQG